MSSHGVGSHRSNARRYPRSARVNEVLREVVADALERLVDAERDGLRLVTVTAVDCEPDLRRAVVMYATLGDEDEAREALEGHRVHLQRAIAQQVRLKRTPHLSFSPDPAILAGRKIEDALRAAPRPPHQDLADLAGRYRWDEPSETQGVDGAR